MTTSLSRGNWLDKFLESEKMVKLAKQIEASFLDHVRLITEGKAIAKWSSVDDALQDFASRHGLSPRELRALSTAVNKNAAGHRLDPTQNIELAQEEGLGSQALEFMSKSKDKHTHDTASPFVLSAPDAKLKHKMRKKEVGRHELDKSHLQDGNEFISSQQTASFSLEQLRRFAAEFGKIMDLPVSEESIPKLEEEMKKLDVSTEYRVVRHAFRFTNMAGKTLSRPDEPVKVTAYQYGVHKRKLAELINQDLRDQLSQELPLEEWMNFLSTLANNPKAAGLKRQLVQLQRDLFGPQAASVPTKEAETPPANVKKIMEFFPASYQRKILELLAEGELRHLLTSDEGREHSQTWRSRWKTGSFVLMESFDPYMKIRPRPESADQKKALAQAIKDSGKLDFTYDDFEGLLKTLGVPYDTVSTLDDSQSFKFGEGAGKIQNKANENYKPVTNKLSETQASDPDAVEKQLVSLHNHLSSSLRRDIEQLRRAEEAERLGKKTDVRLTPLAYEPQADGTFKPLNLFDLQKKDYTTRSIEQAAPGSEPTMVANPYAGLHPSFKGSLEQLSATPGLDMPGGKGSSRWEGVAPRQKTKPKTETTVPAPGSSSRWDDLVKKLEQTPDKLKKFEHIQYMLVKLAALDLFIDDQGRTFQSEKDLEETLFSEMEQEASADILKMVTDMLVATVARLPTPAETPEAPKTPQGPQLVPPLEVSEDEVNEEPVDEEEALPLAASTRIRLKRLSKSSPELQQKLANILNNARK